MNCREVTTAFKVFWQKLLLLYKGTQLYKISQANTFNRRSCGFSTLIQRVLCPTLTGQSSASYSCYSWLIQKGIVARRNTIWTCIFIWEKCWLKGDILQNDVFTFFFKDGIFFVLFNSLIEKTTFCYISHKFPLCYNTHFSFIQIQFTVPDISLPEVLTVTFSCDGCLNANSLWGREFRSSGPTAILMNLRILWRKAWSSFSRTDGLRVSLL